MSIKVISWYRVLFIVAVAFLLAACDSAESEPDSAATSTPEVVSQVTTMEEMVGIYWGRGSSFQSFDAEGFLRVAGTRDKLTSEPVAIGRYWFEDDKMYLHEVQGSACAEAQVGVYEVRRLSNDRLRFDAVSDACTNRLRSLEGSRAGQIPTFVEWELVSTDVPPTDPAEFGEAPANEPVVIESQGEVPFYARFGENETFGDEEVVAIVFYRPPECIPAEFNLMQFFHFPDETSPGAFACAPPTTAGTETWENGPETDPAPLVAELTGRGAVPVWFFDREELFAAMADGQVTIGDLTEMPSRRVGTAVTYAELLHPSQSNAQPLIQFTAEGTLEEGGAFAVSVSNGDPEVTDHVTIEFAE